MQQPVTVSKHDVVELISLILINISSLQCFEVKPDGGDRSFEFMSNSINKVIMLFVTPDFTNKKGGIDYETKDDCQKEDNSKNEECDFAPIEDNPTNVEGD